MRYWLTLFFILSINQSISATNIDELDRPYNQLQKCTRHFNYNNGQSSLKDRNLIGQCLEDCSPHQASDLTEKSMIQDYLARCNNSVYKCSIIGICRRLVQETLKACASSNQSSCEDSTKQCIESCTPDPNDKCSTADIKDFKIGKEICVAGSVSQPIISEEKAKQVLDLRSFNVTANNGRGLIPEATTQQSIFFPQGSSPANPEISKDKTSTASDDSVFAGAGSIGENIHTSLSGLSDGLLKAPTNNLSKASNLGGGESTFPSTTGPPYSSSTPGSSSTTTNSRSSATNSISYSPGSLNLTASNETIDRNNIEKYSPFAESSPRGSSAFQPGSNSPLTSAAVARSQATRASLNPSASRNHSSAAQKNASAATAGKLLPSPKNKSSLANLNLSAEKADLLLSQLSKSTRSKLLNCTQKLKLPLKSCVNSQALSQIEKANILRIITNGLNNKSLRRLASSKRAADIGTGPQPVFEAMENKFQYHFHIDFDGLLALPND